MKRLFLLLLALASPTHAEWRVATDFEGGNAEVVTLDEARGILRIMPALRTGRGWPCWWYFRLDGLQPGQQLTLEVQAQTREFRPGTILNASWCQPDLAAISHDGQTWAQSAQSERTPEKVAIYRLKAAGTSLWAAWGPPFLPSHAEKMLAEIDTRLGDAAERFELAKTREGRSVHGIRIGAVDADRQVWVNARQHAWEAGGAWVGRGFIDWISGKDAAAQSLRQRCCIHYIPIMDVDNVALGAGGKEAIPQDHNRDWSTAPHYPEVAAAQKRILAIEAQHGLDVFLDLHNPGAGDRVPFFFGPFGFESLSALRRENYQRWIELAAAHITSPMRVDSRYRFATYVKTEEERGRMSSGWARAHTSESSISITLETAWNNPHGHSAGYITVGTQLAQALAAYLDGK